jgi:DNA-binding MarR family transcriptional regulator
MQATPQRHPLAPDWADGPPAQALQLAFAHVGRRLRAAYRTDPAAVWVLHALACHGPMRVSALADSLTIDISTTSRHVSGLEAEGMLTRQPDAADRRASLVTLTQAGADFLAHAFEQRARVLRVATESWPDDDVTTLIRLLNRLADDLVEATRP